MRKMSHGGKNISLAVGGLSFGQLSDGQKFRSPLIDRETPKPPEQKFGTGPEFVFFRCWMKLRHRKLKSFQINEMKMNFEIEEF